MTHIQPQRDIKVYIQMGGYQYANNIEVVKIELERYYKIYNTVLTWCEEKLNTKPCHPRQILAENNVDYGSNNISLVSLFI